MREHLDPDNEQPKSLFFVTSARCVDRTPGKPATGGPNVTNELRKCCQSLDSSPEKRGGLEYRSDANDRFKYSITIIKVSQDLRLHS